MIEIGQNLRDVIGMVLAAICFLGFFYLLSRSQ